MPVQSFIDFLCARTSSPTATTTSNEAVGAPLDTTASSSSGSLSTGAIVGIAVGCVLAVAVVMATLAAVFVARRNKANKVASAAATPSSEGQEPRLSVLSEGETANEQKKPEAETQAEAEP